MASNTELIIHILGFYCCILCVFLAKRNVGTYKNASAHFYSRKKSVINFRRHFVVSGLFELGNVLSEHVILLYQCVQQTNNNIILSLFYVFFLSLLVEEVLMV